MARFNASEIENYGGNGGTGFFKLKEDKEVARVRFMYNSLDDVEGYAVHKVKVPVGDKEFTQYVSCLREYDEPLDKCPFCANHEFQIAKLYIPLYNVDTKEVVLWERGKKFYTKLASLFTRYPNLVSHIFEIERNGKPGEMSTTYEIYEVGNDDTTLEDLPEKPNNIIGSVILDKSADEMNYYLDTGEFPANSENSNSRKTDSSEYDRPVRRDSYRESTRRTPASSERRDRF